MFIIKNVGSEPGSTISTGGAGIGTGAGGPSFLKFKQKSDNPNSQAPIRAATEEPVKNNYVPRPAKSNVSESPKEKRDFGKFAKSRPDSEENSEYDIKPIRADRIISPLKPVQTPAVNNNENPEGIKSRLDSERSDIIESIGDLILRQNGLMGKKSDNFLAIF